MTAVLAALTVLMVLCALLAWGTTRRASAAVAVVALFMILAFVLRLIP